MKRMQIRLGRRALAPPPRVSGAPVTSVSLCRRRQADRTRRASLYLGTAMVRQPAVAWKTMARR